MTPTLDARKTKRTDAKLSTRAYLAAVERITQALAANRREHERLVDELIKVSRRPRRGPSVRVKP